MIKHITICLLMFVFSCNNSIPEKEVLREPDSQEAPQTQEKVYITTSKEYTLGPISVKVIQKKDSANAVDCIAKLVVFMDGKIKDSIAFSPEAVGGLSGISPGKEVSGHLIFSKFGDYDGRTLIINSKGKLFNIKGGTNYLDADAQLLFTSYVSDIGGTAVFDLAADKELISGELDFEQLVSVHKLEGRYFFISENTDTPYKTVWEYELDMERFMAIEIDPTDLNSSNALKIIDIGEMENCTCVK